MKPLKIAILGCGALLTFELVFTVVKRNLRRILRGRSVDMLIAFREDFTNCNGNEACTDERCSEHNLKKIVEFIDSARVSMDVCIYMFSSYDLMQALIRAHERGVTVRVIADHDIAYNHGSKIKRLMEKGIKVRSKNSTKLMHHKFCIIDCPPRVEELSPEKSRLTFGQRFLLGTVGNIHRGLLLTGSMNWTQQAMNGNWDHILITSHLPMLLKFHREFEDLWNTFPDFDPFI